MEPDEVRRLDLMLLASSLLMMRLKLILFGLAARALLKPLLFWLLVTLRWVLRILFPILSRSLRRLLVFPLEGLTFKFGFISFLLLKFLLLLLARLLIWVFPRNGLLCSEPVLTRKGFLPIVVLTLPKATRPL